MQNLFVGLFLMVSAGAADLPSGSGFADLPPGVGFFEQTLGEFNQVAWGLEGGLYAFDTRSAGVGPAPCTGTCTFNFTASPRPLWFFFGPGYVVIPTLDFTGPAVTASATCTPCRAPPNQYDTFWGPAAITVRGVVRFVSTGDASQSREFNIIGSGVARAENHFNQALGPWNWSSTRYDFTYAVVPEPNALILFAEGLVLVFILLRSRKARTRGFPFLSAPTTAP